MAALPALAGIRACVFDAYGTLFDIASAVDACRDEIGPEADRLNQMWRDKQLAYTWLRAAQGRHADFWQVTGDALDFALETFAIDRPGLRRRLMDLYLVLKPFPEVPDVLARLKAAGLRTAILSNGTPAMLDALVSAPSSIRCFRSRRSAPSSRTQRSTNLRSTGLACRRGK
jgi:2-haloacid dehalogenase